MKSLRLLPVLIAVAVSPVFAEATRESEDLPRKFKVARKHHLTLHVPSDCVVTESSSAASPLEITLAPKTGREYRIMISVLPIHGKNALLSTPEGLQLIVETQARTMLRTAQESEVAIVRLNGEGGTGFFFALTDKRAELPPNEYRQVCQGVMLVGQLRLTATLLTDELTEITQGRFYELLRTARWSKK